MSVGLPVSGQSDLSVSARLLNALARTPEQLDPPHAERLGVEVGVGVVLQHDQPQVLHGLAGLHRDLARNGSCIEHVTMSVLGEERPT